MKRSTPAVMLKISFSFKDIGIIKWSRNSTRKLFDYQHYWPVIIIKLVYSSQYCCMITNNYLH